MARFGGNSTDVSSTLTPLQLHHCPLLQTEPRFSILLRLRSIRWSSSSSSVLHTRLSSLHMPGRKPAAALRSTNAKHPSQTFDAPQIASSFSTKKCHPLWPRSSIICGRHYCTTFTHARTLLSSFCTGQRSNGFDHHSFDISVPDRINSQSLPCFRLRIRPVGAMQACDSATVCIHILSRRQIRPKDAKELCLGSGRCDPYLWPYCNSRGWRLCQQSVARLHGSTSFLFGSHWRSFRSPRRGVSACNRVSCLPLYSCLLLLDLCSAGPLVIYDPLSHVFYLMPSHGLHNFKLSAEWLAPHHFHLEHLNTLLGWQLLQADILSPSFPFLLSCGGTLVDSVQLLLGSKITTCVGYPPPYHGSTVIVTRAKKLKALQLWYLLQFVFKGTGLHMRFVLLAFFFSHMRHLHVASYLDKNVED